MDDKIDKIIAIARTLAGAPPIPTRDELVMRFLFNEEEASVTWKSYAKPPRAVLFAQIEQAVMEGQEAYMGRKRPKLLAGSVFKRVYSTYPETEAFKEKWRKLDEQVAAASERARKAETEGKFFASLPGVGRGLYRGHHEKNRLTVR